MNGFSESRIALNEFSSECPDLGTLGKLKLSLRPKRENIVAGYLAVLLVTCIAIFVLYTAPDRFAPLGSYMFGGVLLVGAGGLLWYVLHITSLSVHIYEHGL